VKLARALALLTLCFLDLHVRAEDPVFNAEAGRRRFTVGDARLTLARGGLARAEKDHAVRLIRGAALVAGRAGEITIVTPFARGRCEGGCEALFTRDEQSITIESLTEGWSIRRTGEDREYGLGSALRVVVGRVGRDGRAAVSTAETLPWASLIGRWAALYVDGAEAFTARVHAFRPAWDEAVDRMSDEQRSRSVAMIDAADASARRREAARRAEAAEDARVRAEYRARNYVSDDAP
jgi:hypothetical protein